MDSEQLTPFGRYVMEKLQKIGKTEAWLTTKLKSEGNFTTIEQLHAVMTGENQSRPKQAVIGMVLHAEEERQRLKRVAGIHERRNKI
jgi:hypothetical protein